MTSGRAPERLGRYVFALAPYEAEAAAARIGTRAALGGRLFARHVAPFLIFALVVAFAFLLAFFGLIARPAGKTAMFLAAIAFVAQRIISQWLVWRAHAIGRRAASARLHSDGELAVSIDEDGLAIAGGGRLARVSYADCAAVEAAGALIYVWPREGEPILLPKRVLPNGEAARLVAQIGERVRQARATQAERTF